MTAQPDQYEFWRRRIAGETLPIHDGDPQAGFYRLKGRNGEPDHPVAYWWKEGELRCRIGAKDVTEQVARERWMWASKEPITHELYKAVVAGDAWLDQHPAVTGHNRAPIDNSFDGLQQAIEDLAREADTLVKAGAAKTQDAADRAADLAGKLSDLKKKAEAAFKSEKEPIEEQVDAIREKWRPVIAAAAIYSRLKEAVITPFLNSKDAAEKTARMEAAKAGAPLLEPVRSTTKAGTRGRSTALREVKTAKITDYDKALAYFAKSVQVRELVQTLANATVRAGVTPDGCEIHTEKKAA